MYFELNMLWMVLHGKISPKGERNTKLEYQVWSKRRRHMFCVNSGWVDICCFAGYFSWRNTQQGSWFIRALTDELQKAISSTTDVVDFAQVLTKVARTVAYDFESKAAVKTMNAKKQVPSLYSTLTKEIHFPNCASDWNLTEMTRTVACDFRSTAIIQQQWKIAHPVLCKFLGPRAYVHVLSVELIPVSVFLYVIFSVLRTSWAASSKVCADIFEDF